MGYNHEQYERQTLKAMGLDYDKLTEGQRYIALEPLNAPENYHCDGEISVQQAAVHWSRRLKAEGFTTTQIIKIKSVIG